MSTRTDAPSRPQGDGIHHGIDEFRSRGVGPDEGMDDRIDLLELVRVVWARKGLALGIVLGFVLLAVLYAYVATPWYRAEILLAPSDRKLAGSLASQFGGLASIAGLDVGQTDAAQPVAILRSKGFAGAFIRKHGLTPVLLADRMDDATDGALDIRDAVFVFTRRVCKVAEDKRTGLVTVTIEWTDPAVAAQWARWYVDLLNETMRERALTESKTNIAYLRAELETTPIPTLQQSLGRLLETELQKSMVARGNQEYAFKVIDEPEVPKFMSKPRRGLVLLLGAFAGTISALFVVFALQSMRGPARAVSR